MICPYEITVFVVFLYLIPNVNTEYHVVTTKLGKIRGLEAEDGYSMFLGVPYAKVNATNPFGESLPYPHFETVFDAIDDSTMCPQQEEFNNTIGGTLDCLRLNIYVPRTKDHEQKIPVLAYIYGGYFKIGFASRLLYGPKYLVRHGVILVTFNYRTGPYGFFCTDTPEVPGNQGCKDQVTALKWIHDNIEAFGGDSDKITVSGHSFGASSLENILYSLNDSEKLFDKAIFQSHSIYNPDVWKGRPDEREPLKIADYLGLKTKDVSEALAYISNVDADKVIAASVDLSSSFAYCIEKKFDNVKSFISDFPSNLKIPSVKNMPILIGNSNAESVVTYFSKSPVYFENLRLFFDALHYFDLNDDYRSEIETIIRQSYLRDEKVSQRVVKEIIDFTSDFYYYHVARRKMLKYIENGAKNVFYYIFSFNGGRNFLKIRGNMTYNGAVHGDELGYLFDMAYLNKTPTHQDQVMIDRITLLWTNFVKYGDPTPQTSELLPIKWKPYTNEAQYYLDMNSELSLKSAPFHSRMAFWDLFFELNGKFERGYRGVAT